MLSVVLLAVLLLGVGTFVAGYFWWSIRPLHRQARAFGDEGRTIGAEVVPKDSYDDDIAKR